jgi:hypothetical protein
MGHTTQRPYLRLLYLEHKFKSRERRINLQFAALGSPKTLLPVTVIVLLLNANALNDCVSVRCTNEVVVGGSRANNGLLAALKGGHIRLYSLP